MSLISETLRVPSGALFFMLDWVIGFIFCLLWNAKEHSVRYRILQPVSYTHLTLPTILLV